VLYVDNVTATNSFSDEDLQFLIAFGGIAAAGIRASMQADELQEQAIVRGSFERYFAPGVAAEIARNAGATRLGGDRRPIAVLFSDVRGFTRLAEGMTPEALASLLSDYFTEMVEVVFEHGGTLDKFVGDAIMALWGAPQAQDDAPDRAVRAALAMQEALVHLNARWKSEGRPELGVGIGVNFGEVFVGNIGSHRRLEYTVIGDVVNVAARLCAEAGAGEILVADGVRAATTAGWRYEALEPMGLKGREERVGVYRVLSS
jgi:adenylate cyclase